NDDLVGLREAVQLDEQLVERLVLLAVEAVARPSGAHGVELVDEHDRRRVLASVLEEPADAGGTEAREHRDGRRRTLRVGGGSGLVRARLREQGLPGAGRAVEKDPLGDARAGALELVRVAE